MAKARILNFDAETYRTMREDIAEAIRAEAIAKRPANNVAKDLKTVWDTADAREERAAKALAKTAVDVTIAEPLCVCFAAYESVDAAPEANAADMMLPDQWQEAQREELRLLAEAWSDLTGPDTIWLGHNIIKFDIPLLYNSWLRNGIAPPEHFPQFLYGRWRGRIFDTMARIPSGDGYISLDAACAAFGVPVVAETLWRGAPVDGSRVGEIYEAGDYNVILEYCKRDLPPVFDLYKVLTSDDTRGTYDKTGATWAQVEEIRASEGLSDGQKLLAIYTALELGGVLRRAS